MRARLVVSYPQAWGGPILGCVEVVSRWGGPVKELVVTDLERIVDMVLLLAPHRQRLVLATAVALLELQLEVDGVTGMDSP